MDSRSPHHAVILPPLALIIALLAIPAVVPGEDPPPEQALAREIFRELVEIDTTDASGNNTEAAEAMAKRLRAAGFAAEDVKVLGPHPKKGNLVARLRGHGKKRPILLLAHLDVVDAHPDDWSVDPFTFLERNGYFYGRGTSDDKAMASIWVTNLILMKQENFLPERDVILALTADEEGGDHNGVEWLLANHRELIEADLCLNEGGGGQSKDGRHLLNSVQLSEKVYQSFSLEVKDPGGHSSQPRQENAIYRLADALSRIQKYRFPVRLDEITGTFFERMSQIESGPLARDMRAVARSAENEEAVARLTESPYYNALMRTTCVATQLEAGHAENALPQTARATINCRILPGDDPKAVEAKLLEVIGDRKVRLTALNRPRPSQPSPLTHEIMGPIERITEEFWPGVPVVPTMVTGATDGLYLRNAGIPTYGVSGLFGDINDVRAHGRDERIRTRSFYEGRAFLDRLIRELAR